MAWARRLGSSSALDARGIPVAPTNRHLPNTRTEHPFAHTPAPNYGPFAVNLICENAVVMPALAEHMGEGFFTGRHTIGMWFWEVSGFPERWDSSFEPGRGLGGQRPRRRGGTGSLAGC